MNFISVMVHFIFLSFLDISRYFVWASTCRQNCGWLAFSSFNQYIHFLFNLCCAGEKYFVSLPHVLLNIQFYISKKRGLDPELPSTIKLIDFTTYFFKVRQCPSMVCCRKGQFMLLKVSLLNLRLESRHLTCTYHKGKCYWRDIYGSCELTLKLLHTLIALIMQKFTLRKMPVVKVQKLSFPSSAATKGNLKMAYWQSPPFLPLIKK